MIARAGTVRLTAAGAALLVRLSEVGVDLTPEQLFAAIEEGRDLALQRHPAGHCTESQLADAFTDAIVRAAGGAS